MLHEDRERAESFGAVAELYDRARPSYPPALIDALLESHPRRVLDVGCGTGIATALLAQRGCDVLGVEIDARMAAVAGGKGLAVEVARFEDWDDAGRRFDIVTSAQAWHWVDPTTGAAKAAAVLADGGSVGLFWNMGEPPAAVRDALVPVYARLAPPLRDSFSAVPEKRGVRVEQTIAGLERSGAFAPAQLRTFAWSQTYDTDAWVERVSTKSEHQTLPRELRGRLLAGVRDALDALGGSFAMAHETVLVSASLLPR
jgi:SAM-dependent methyltransferase